MENKTEMYKARISYHIVFVTKYRRKVLSPNVLELVKEVLEYAASRHNFSITAFDSENQDHVHLVIEARPTQSISKLVQLMKQYTRYHAWQKYAPWLRKFYWYRNFLWSSGYFSSSLGNVSKETILEYVERQNE